MGHHVQSLDPAMFRLKCALKEGDDVKRQTDPVNPEPGRLWLPHAHARGCELSEEADAHGVELYGFTNSVREQCLDPFAQGAGGNQ